MRQAKLLYILLANASLPQHIAQQPFFLIYIGQKPVDSNA
jgi:hypothetical protein